MDFKEVPFMGLQGISQRPAEARNEGQVDDMVGFFPTPAEGMQTAPHSCFCGKLDLTNIPNQTLTKDMAFKMGADVNGDLYYVCVTGDETTPVVAWDWNGDEIVVTFSGDTKEYIKPREGYTPNSALGALSVADYTVVINKSITVEQAGYPALTGKTVGMKRLTVLKGATGSEVTYIANIGDEQLVHTEPHNSTDSLDEIASQITSTINTDSAFDDYTAIQYGESIEIAHVTPATSFTLTTETASTLGAISDVANSFADLPRQGVASGTILRVQPPADHGIVVPYWVEYNDGVWAERGSPTAHKGFGSDSEHQLPIAATIIPPQEPNLAQLQFSEYTYAQRDAGDEESNRDPYFVDNKILDVLMFQDRVGFVSARGIDWSRIGDYTSFYRATAVETYEDDPILMTFGGTDRDIIVHQAVPFHDVVFVDTNSGKYTVSGNENGFTATTVVVDRVSALRGVPNGPIEMVEDKLFFPVDGNKFMQFREYDYGDDHIDVEPSDITNDVPRLVPRDVSDSWTFDEVRTVLYAEHGSSDAYAYRFDLDLENDQEKTQSAWFRLALPEHVGSASFGAVYFFNEDGWITRYDLRAGNEEHTLANSTDLELIDDEWFLPALPLEFFQGAIAADTLQGYIEIEGDRPVYRPIFSIDPVTGKMTLGDEYGLSDLAEGDIEITRFAVGVPQEVSVTIPRPFVRRQDGSGVSYGTMRLNSIMFNTRNSGEYTVTTLVADRDPMLPTYVRSHTFGEDYELGVQGLDAPQSVRRIDKMPYKGKADGLSVVVTAESVRPLDIVSVGWNYRYISNRRII